MMEPLLEPRSIKLNWIRTSKYLYYIVVATVANWLQIAQFTAALRFQSWPQ